MGVRWRVKETAYLRRSNQKRISDVHRAERNVLLESSVHVVARA
jgi:hypothetical protein